jgi:hypothetical protein
LPLFHLKLLSLTNTFSSQNVAAANKEIETLNSQPLEDLSAPRGDRTDGRPSRGGKRGSGERSERTDRKKINGNSTANADAEADKTSPTQPPTEDFAALSTDSKEAPEVEA